MKTFKKLITVFICSLLLAVTIGSDISECSVSEAAVETYSKRNATNSKKGLQIAEPSDVKDLGISEAFMNIDLNEILNADSASKYSIAYQGTTYYFNETFIDHFTETIRNLSDDGINFTVAIVLNGFDATHPDLYYPGVGKHSGTNYYGINTSTDAGRKMVEATMHFVASRFNGGANGLISNYVIGNEVNYGSQYNYYGDLEIDPYTQLYYQTFKTITNAIKAENSSARTYICVAPRWAQLNRTDVYSGRDLILKFAALAKADNIDWNLAFHAYSYPLSRQNILRDGEVTLDTKGKNTVGGEVTNSQDTLWISIKNLNVLTDFMQKEELLDSKGNVRSIILSEQGYTSYSNVFGGTNETVQAANIAYAYYVAEMNPYIDAFILNGHIEHGSTYKFGLLRDDRSKKPAWNMYKYIDTDKSLEVTEFAKATLGIDEWSKAVRYWDDSKFSSMKSITNSNLLSIPSAASATGGVVLNNGAFEGDVDYWTGEFYMHGTSKFDHEGHPVASGVLVMNGNANNDAYQVIRKSFVPALDCSSTPFIGLGIKMISDKTDSKYIGKEYTEMIRIRLYSGNNVFDANAGVKTDTTNYLFADVSTWGGKTKIDKIEIWVQEQGTDSNYGGVIAPYEFMTASSLTGSTKLSSVANTMANTITPDPTYALTTPYDYTKDVPSKPDPVDPGSTPFTDLVAGKWYLKAVNYVYSNKIMSGVTANTFEPDTPCTRGMMVTILYSVSGKPEAGANAPFTDLKANWYKTPIAWAYNNKVCSGKSATSFEPDANVTRQEMAVFLMSYAGLRGFDTSARADVSKYADASQIGGWAKEQIQWANANGIISGKTATTLVPKGNATRAEVAQMIMSFQNKFGK